jgi:hypothetical protein
MLGQAIVPIERARMTLGSACKVGLSVNSPPSGHGSGKLPIIPFFGKSDLLRAGLSG